ncbi:hypothetical protein FRB99_001645 [Tulasnella sp. 403]|nr:hypothetical protein FRB99_001645 [Tulasnella sp. 403]
MADDASVVSSSRPPSPSTPVAENDNVTPLPLNRRAPGPYRFHWDPSAKRPGPPSISDATESRVDLSVDTSVKTESIFNVGAGSLALPPTWSSSQHGFNAISTVLNNPHTRPNPLKSSRAPIFTGPSPDLPRLRRKDFDPYLKAIGPEWEKFQKNQKLAKEAASELAVFSSASSTSNDTASDEAPSPPPPKASKNAPPPPLSNVPPVYFEADFDLGNLRTFLAVTERSSVEGSTPNEDLSTNQALQDKLSGHLDIVEQHLTIEIQNRSPSFFAALSNLHSLQAEGAQCLSRISQLRKELVEVDEKQAKKGLEIARLLKRSDNLTMVQEGVRAIQAVGESVGLIKNLVSAGQYFEGLGMIEELEALFEKPPNNVTAPTDVSSASSISTAPPPSSRTSLSITTLPLSSIVSLSTLPQSLRGLSSSVSSSLSADLVALLRADLTRDRDDALVPQTPVDAALHERMLPLLQGLARTGGIEEAVKAYQDVALSEVRACVRQYLPASEWDEEDKAAAAASLVRTDSEMSHDEFMKISRAMYSTLLSRINIISNHVSSITAVNSTLLPSTGEAETSSPTLFTLVSSAAELGNNRASKLIALRSDQHAQLPLPSFLEIFNLSWAFVVKCEVVARRMIVGLRGVVVGQAKSWLMTFHGARIGKAAKAVEEETWAQVEVSSESQAIVNSLVDAAMADPKSFVLDIPLDGVVPHSPKPPSNGTSQNGTPSSNGSSPSGPSSKVLRIEDRTYFVVGATMEVLELMVDYLKVIINLPLLTTDTMSRIIEYLKAFNSRTCQVVLGAGAMRSAGLKNITAKHLALASQSLSVMIALVPYIRETLRRHLNPKQAVILVEFDKLKRDLQEHQNEIHSKLIAIMGDRLAVHCRSLADIQWDVPPIKPGPNAYMEVLVKETVTLHKVLSKYLPTPIVEKLSGLKGVTVPAMLETVVMEKPIPRKGAPFPTRRPSTQSPNPIERRLSSLTSPPVNGSPGRPGSRPGTPTMHSLLAGGRSSPSPMPTPPGQATPPSPMARSPYTSPRLRAADASTSPRWPSSPVRDSALLAQLNSPKLTFSSPVMSPTLEKPPVPDKDQGYGLGLRLPEIEASAGSSILSDVTELELPVPVISNGGSTEKTVNEDESA